MGSGVINCLQGLYRPSYLIFDFGIKTTLGEERKRNGKKERKYI